MEHINLLPKESCEIKQCLQLKPTCRLNQKKTSSKNGKVFLYMSHINKKIQMNKVIVVAKI